MSGTVKEAKLQTQTVRARLKRGRQPHWRTVIPGRAHLGYQRWPSDDAGRWVLRRYASGRYSVEAIGRADDGDGEGFDYEAAFAKAQAKVGAAPTTRLTVRKAVTLYVEYLEAQGKGVRDAINRGGTHILPKLGDLEVAALTPTILRNWLAEVARTPAQLRSVKGGKLNFRPLDLDDAEAVREREQDADDLEGRP